MIKIRKLDVTEENHRKFDSVGESRYGRNYREALEAMGDIGRVLDENLPHSNRVDWAGKYHSWLQRFGVNPETQNGWWSTAAILPDNVELFIESMKNENMDYICLLVQNHISVVGDLFTLHSNTDSVKNIINSVLPSLLCGAALQKLYDSEINFSTGWMWDGGVDFRFSDLVYAADLSTVTTTDKKIIYSALLDIGDEAVKNYPKSDFTEWWKLVCFFLGREQ
jgi:hypothetical protein